MKKSIKVLFALAVVTVMSTSCYHHHVCATYVKADKVDVEKTVTVEKSDESL